MGMVTKFEVAGFIEDQISYSENRKWQHWKSCNFVAKVISLAAEKLI